MPYKRCPLCSTDNGPRTKLCKTCNYNFDSDISKLHEIQKKRKQPQETNKKVDYLYPEPGLWIVEEVKQMKDPVSPEPLPKNKQLTNTEIADYVRYDGLGFCIYSYIPPDKIADPILKDLWVEARNALVEVMKVLDG